MADRKNPEIEVCPECGKLEVLQHLGSPPLLHSGESICNSGRIDPGFKEVLQRIKKNNRGSDLG